MYFSQLGYLYLRKVSKSMKLFIFVPIFSCYARANIVLSICKAVIYYSVRKICPWLNVVSKCFM